jgi:hypothetical protein
LRANHEKLSDTQIGQQGLKVGIFERVSVVLLNERFRGARGELGNDLPTVGPTREVLIRMLDPDHRDAVLARSVDKQPNVGHDGGALMSLLDNSILHVNYEKCGV